MSLDLAILLFVHVKMGENHAIGRFCLKWIFVPYEDKLMLFPHSASQFNILNDILFRGGGAMVFLPHSANCSERVADFDAS